VADFLTFPDAEEICCTALSAFSAVPANPTYPLLVAERAGGSPSVRRALDKAIIRVTSWGGTKAQARDNAEAARRALLELEGVHPVTGVEDAQGLTWQPDIDTNRARYVFAMAVYVKGS
jgi:hypothetical protein